MPPHGFFFWLIGSGEEPKSYTSPVPHTSLFDQSVFSALSQNLPPLRNNGEEMDGINPETCTFKYLHLFISVNSRIIPSDRISLF